MRRILRRWRQRVAGEAAASEPARSPCSRGMGALPVRSRGVNGCPWFSPSPLRCPSALTATLPPPPPLLLGLPSAEVRALQWGESGGRVGCGGAEEWLFVLECGGVQLAVEPLG